MSTINKFLATFVVVLCITDGGLFKKIPDFISVCKRDPETVNGCVAESITLLKPKLSEGIPELDVPSIDPFFIPKIVMIDGQNNALRAVGRNVKVTGGSDFTIKSLTVDLDTLTIRTRVKIPILHFDGEYELNTKILALPLSGNGTLKADAKKCEAEITLKAELYKKNGVQYIKFVSMDCDIKIKDYTMMLNDLFNGDKVLGEAANEAINQNKGEFLMATKPSLEKAVSKLMLDIANKVVDDLPFDEVLPKP